MALRTYSSPDASPPTVENRSISFTIPPDAHASLAAYHATQLSPGGVAQGGGAGLCSTGLGSGTMSINPYEIIEYTARPGWAIELFGTEHSLLDELL